MLYLNPIEIDGLTLFPDDLDPLRFYYLPSGPRLSRKENGQFELSLLKYRGQGEVGGLLTLQVDLGLEPERLEKVRSQLKAQGQVWLEPVPFVGGLVDLVIFDKKYSPQQPALLADNRAVFSVALKQNEVALVEASLAAGGFAPVGVYYALDYLALRPAYAFRLQADWTSVHHRLEEKFSLNALFIKVEIEKIFDELIQNSVIKIQLDTFVPENEETGEMIGDRNRMLKELQDLLLATFFKTEVKPVKIEPASDPLSFLPGFGYKLIEITQIDTRTLDFAMNERSVVRRSVYPQGQLQANLDPKHFVTVIDLDDPYFRTRRVEVICRANLEQDAIQAVVATLDYNGNPKSVRYDSSTASQVVSWNSLLSNQGTQREVKTRYTVYFKNILETQRPASLASAETITSLDYLEIYPRELYTIQPVPIITLKAFPWDRYQSVEVKVLYTDPANGLRLTATFLLNKAAPQQTWPMFALDRTLLHFQYKLLYKGADGHRDVAGPWLEGQDQIIVKDPFPQQRSLNVVPPDDWSGIREISVELVYQDLAHNIDERQTLWFSPADPADKTFRANLRNPDQHRVAYQVTVYFKDERVWEIPWSTTLDKRLFLQKDMPARRVIELQSREIDFETYRIAAIKVEIYHQDPRFGQTTSAEFTFDSADDRAYFQFDFSEEAHSSYSYRAVYLYTDGRQGWSELQEGAGEVVSLAAKTIEAFLLKKLEVSAKDTAWQQIKSVQLKLQYKDEASKLTAEKEMHFDGERVAPQYWEVLLKDQAKQSYHWQCVLTMYEKQFGSSGKLYWPGPTKDEWGLAETNSFLLSSYLPAVERLAQLSDLFLVKISSAGFDWQIIEAVTLNFKYGKTKKVKLEENDNPETFFLVPLRKEADQPIKNYEWQAAFSLYDRSIGAKGKLYYPGPGADEWTKTDQAQLLLKDYLTGLQK